MAKPTPFNWATNPNYATGPDTGTATKVAPSAGEIADGFVNGNAAVAQHMNWVLGRVDAWLDYLNGLNTDADFLDDNFTWTGNHTFDQDITLSVGSVEVNYPSGSRPTRLKAINLLRGSFTDSSGVQIAGGDYLGATSGIAFPSGGSTFLLPVDVPKDSGITQVRVSSALGGSYDIGMEVFRVVAVIGGDGVRTSLGTDSVTGVSGQQNLSVSFAESSNPTGLVTFEVHITCSGAGRVQNVVVDFLDSGPRTVAV